MDAAAPRYGERSESILKELATKPTRLHYLSTRVLSRHG
ncbi:hypothetical protein ACVIM8_001740 [Bradyrhizobium sp. USDA 4529]